MFEEELRRRAIRCPGQQLLVHAGGAAHDEVAARCDVVAHEQLEDALGGVDLAGVDAPQRARGGVHGGLGQLVGVHLAEALVALDLPLDLRPAGGDLAQLACICFSL
jgi:hypothetical protein